MLLLAVGDAVNERFGDADPADYELEITGCGTSEGKLIPSIVGRLTNTSDLERGWRLDVYVNDGDVRVGERDILIDPLPSGSAANIDRVIPIRDADPSAVTCTVEVNYWRIEG